MERADNVSELYRELGLTTEEFEEIKRLLGREPTKVELGMYSLMWSEHCSYKSSKPILKMLPTEGEHVLQGPGENAGIVDIGDGLAVAFKMESHNHPSAVEPYQGAATGIGGIVRDIFTMGARPIACLDPLRFGDLSKPRTRYLVSGVVAGIAGYGNCLGIPTVAGDVYFDPCYDENPLVNVMCAGVMPSDRIIKGAADRPGEAVILFGNRTGRDGIGGASVLASQEFDENSEAKRPSVQVGDPFTEKLLIEACLEMLDRELLVGVSDLGAAGLSCALSEMAAKGGVGMEVHAERVPLREQMEPFEIMISESQERMLAVCEPENTAAVLKICERWGLRAVQLGEVVEGDRLTIYWHGETVVDVPATSLADGPTYERDFSRPDYLDEVAAFDTASLEHPRDLNDVLLRLATSPNLSSRHAIYEQYDHMVQTNTAVYPGSDAAVLRLKGTGKGLALTCDGNGRYVYLDPYRGAQIAVAEAARNVVASGAEPIAVTNCLNFGNPERPGIFWQFVKAVEGISDACKAFGLPVVSGNVSFYNESFGEAIHPTPVIGMLGLLEDIETRRTVAFRDLDDLVVLVGETLPELGGSEYLRAIHGVTAGIPPQLDLAKERRVQDTVRQAIEDGYLISAHDCSEGGIAMAVIDSCWAGDIGATVEIETGMQPAEWLFSESQSRFVVSLKKMDLPRLQELAEARGVPVEVLGSVGGRHLVINDWIAVDVALTREAWRAALGDALDGR
ncbi:MAG: phosphoribosylformylglycinamidine synthase subunit PurL [Candidatus Geothermincolia bacterium]